MLKKCPKFLIATVVLFVGFGIMAATALDLDIRESSLVVNDDFDMSYEAMPSEQIIEFFKDRDIDLNGNKYDITKAIDKLRDCDSCNDDLWETAKDELNYYINRVLFTATREGYTPVYMTLGNTRWIVSPADD